MPASGLASAIRWYVDGFSQRSQIKVELEIPESLGRLSDEMELAIFRMVQECLTNIHRHSGSSTAKIVMRQEEKEKRMLVRVEDSGKGIPPQKQMELASSGRTGIGFRGMRERLRQLGGDLSIHSDDHGTVVAATLPMPVENRAVDLQTKAAV